MKFIRKYFMNNIQTSLSFVLTLLLFLGIAIFEQTSQKEFSALAVNASILGIIALGQTIVILIGGIDFSMQWVLAAAAISMSHIYIGSILSLSEMPLGFILLIALLIATAIGSLNGIGVAYFGINPMIMTFAINALVYGVLLAWTNGISGKIAPPEIKEFLNQSIGPIPVIAYIWFIIIVLATFMLSFTKLGRKIYAVGSNEMAARCSGIRVKRIKLMAYCLSGFMAGVGGILMSGQLGTSSLNMSENVTIQSVLAVMLGGTAISGGKGNYLKSVLGAIMLTEIMYIFSCLSVHTGVQKTLLGVILLVAVVLSSLVGNRKRNTPHFVDYESLRMR